MAKETILFIKISKGTKWSKERSYSSPIMHPKLFTLFHLSVGQTISQTLNVALSILKLGLRFSIYCNRQSVLHKMNTCSCAQVYIYISLLLANHIPVSTKPQVVSLAARPEGRFTCRTAFSSGKLTVNDILMSRTLQNLRSLQLLPPEPSRAFPNLEFRNLYFQNLLGTRLQSSLSILLLRKKSTVQHPFSVFPNCSTSKHLTCCQQLFQNHIMGIAISFISTKHFRCPPGWIHALERR